ncbi:TetR/AcrR family transcriptional regulator [Rhodobacteraceae bacterium D3-12]|nr:TetR/AcrR family transcriptional regulator [Rhodobacteraceae bacterium D3-12]
MTQRSERKPRSRSYHHGTLRETLISEGRRMLEKTGPVELSLRQVARSAGVSEAAPARHFDGKDGLLAAIATQGFQELTAIRREIVARKLDNLRTAYEMMRSYVDFAIGKKGVFNLMVGPRLIEKRRHEALQAAGAESFEYFAMAVKNLANESGWPEHQVELVAHFAWSVEHGLATLILGDRAPRSSRGMTLDEMIGFSISFALNAIRSGPSNFEEVMAIVDPQGSQN